MEFSFNTTVDRIMIDGSLVPPERSDDRSQIIQVKLVCHCSGTSMDDYKIRRVESPTYPTFTILDLEDDELQDLDTQAGEIMSEHVDSDED